MSVKLLMNNVVLTIGCALVLGGCADQNAPWSTTPQAATTPEHGAYAANNQHGSGYSQYGGTGGTVNTIVPQGDAMYESLSPADRASAMRTTAVDLLLQAAQSRNPLLRANAIESLQNAPHFAEPIVRRGIVDENRGVRFVAAMTIGRLKLTELSHLLEPLKNDESGSVQAAALYGLHRCGHDVDLNPIAGFLFSSDPEVKANAALVLGELGNRSAVPMLKAAIGKGLNRTSAIRARLVDLQMAEAMVKLGEENEIEGIRAALFSPAEQGELTALAALICGRLKDERMAVSLQDLAVRSGNRRQPAEVRMAATLALAQIDPNKAPIDVPLSFLHSDRPELRMQAALTLGYIGGAESERAVQQLLGDNNPMVQVASAGAVLQIQSVQGGFPDSGAMNATAGSIDTNQSPRYKKELSQAGDSR